MKKLSLECDVPDDVIKMFLDQGIKEEDVDQYIKVILNKLVQTTVNSLSEMMVALNSGAASPQEIFDRMYILGANIGTEEREKYCQKSDADKKS